VPVVRGVNLPDEEAEAYAIADNRLVELGGWDDETPAEVLSDLAASEGLEGVGFDEDDLDELLVALVQNEATDARIGRSGRKYHHDISPMKLGFRLEAAYHSIPGLALDLFSGDGQLAWWYARRFDRVIRVDKAPFDGLDYQMSAEEFISGHLSEYSDFDFVDFDDEGSPAGVIQAFFAQIKDRDRPFVLALTDGMAMALKFRGKWNPGRDYLIGHDQTRQATREDYENFTRTVVLFIKRLAERHAWVAETLNVYRGHRGNVVYAAFEIHR
jgi:hypothetical protein